MLILKRIITWRYIFLPPPTEITMIIYSIVEWGESGKALALISNLRKTPWSFSTNSHRWRHHFLKVIFPTFFLLLITGFINHYFLPIGWTPLSVTKGIFLIFCFIDLYSKLYNEQFNFQNDFCSPGLTARLIMYITLL